MANAKIEAVGPTEYELLSQLYNGVARPPVDVAFLKRRLDHHRRVLCLIAEVEGKPVGFAAGYELRPTTYYSWLYGVLPDARRMGIASQLMDAQYAWVQAHKYEMIRLECYNRYRPMIHLAIKRGYDIVGIRWDSHTANNLVILEKNMSADEE